MTDERWDWVEETEGGVGIIAVIIPALGLGTSPIPLTFRSRALAEQMRPYARQHAERSGRRVWLRRWIKYVDLEDA